MNYKCLVYLVLLSALKSIYCATPVVRNPSAITYDTIALIKEVKNEDLKSLKEIVDKGGDENEMFKALMFGLKETGKDNELYLNYYLSKNQACKQIFG